MPSLFHWFFLYLTFLHILSLISVPLLIFFISISLSFSYFLSLSLSLSISLSFSYFLSLSLSLYLSLLYLLSLSLSLSRTLSLSISLQLSITPSVSLSASPTLSWFFLLFLSSSFSSIFGYLSDFLLNYCSLSIQFFFIVHLFLIYQFLIPLCIYFSSSVLINLTMPHIYSFFFLDIIDIKRSTDSCGHLRADDSLCLPLLCKSCHS